MRCLQDDRQVQIQPHIIFHVGGGGVYCRQPISIVSLNQNFTYLMLPKSKVGFFKLRDIWNSFSSRLEVLPIEPTDKVEWHAMET